MATLKVREEKFAEAFNKTIGDIVKKSNQTPRPEQYYENLDVSQIIELKKTLSTVNNIITLKAAQAFVRKLKGMNIINADTAKNILEEINMQSGNENGYDIRCDYGNFKFIAEVKCNIPAGSKKECFDSGQLAGIYKDLVSLSFRPKGGCPLQDYYKFMVFLDCKNIVKAISTLKKNQPKPENYNIRTFKLTDNEIQSIWKNLVDKNIHLTSLLKEKIYIYKVTL